MPLYCYPLCANLPYTLKHDTFTHTLVEPSSTSSLLSFLHHKHPHNLSRHLSFASKFDEIYSSHAMEEDRKMFGLVSSEQEECYSKELGVAVRAVHMACCLSHKLDYNSTHDYEIADWSVQAIVSWIFSRCLGNENFSILVKDDVKTLTKTDASGLLESVVKTVDEILAESPRFGIQETKSPLGTSEIIDMIKSHCNNSVGGLSGKFWTLSPGDQHAVALSLIEDGEVVLGVLGCPNYPIKKEWSSYPYSYLRIMSKLAPPTHESWNKGCVVYAKRGSGKAWKQPLLLHAHDKFVWPNHAKQVCFSSIEDPSLATFCETVEKANPISHSFTQGLAHTVGLRKQPLKVYSMAKYAAIAHGDAEAFMKFAKAGYKERIWDHAAGFIIMQEAGGMVTDARGSPLNFSKGLDIEGIDRGIVASCGATLHEKIIDAIDASWTSSCL
ncbi:PAP-specific phosphatase HAL2-like [Arachis duranensis]|uniref:3'(2'),5'-bisphosphate nucleotidase n=1 Tax=Arachis duranensis TaxID=130453 RepID=A0A6P4CTW3_ARADU|nr:PAP-specific phosphatase HAL2-like [Arachis duranensis]